MENSTGPVHDLSLGIHEVCSLYHNEGEDQFGQDLSRFFLFCLFYTRLKNIANNASLQISFLVGVFCLC